MRIGEGDGNPLQCSCLENPRDGGAWWAAVYGVAQSWTRLKWLSSSSNSRDEDDIRHEHQEMGIMGDTIKSVHHTSSNEVILHQTLTSIPSMNLKWNGKSFSCVRLFATPWTVAHQAPLSMDFSSKNTGVGCHALPQGIFPPRDQTCTDRWIPYHWATREACSALGDKIYSGSLTS